ncbi:MAG: hypothetical protein U0M06_12915 [Clostridia bacterium]|nr:hypothetical protein [Clostridia bacterium]
MAVGVRQADGWIGYELTDRLASVDGVGEIGGADVGDFCEMQVT